jgi:hypothetical protein
MGAQRRISKPLPHEVVNFRDRLRLQLHRTISRYVKALPRGHPIADRGLSRIANGLLIITMLYRSRQHRLFQLTLLW